MKQSSFFSLPRVLRFTVIVGIQYVVLTVMGMWLYPGSTCRNKNTEGYLFTQNFLSDLGQHIVFDGETNYVGATIYFWALCCAGVSIALFFLGLHQYFKKFDSTRTLSLVMASVGVGAGIGLIGVSCVPSNISYGIHLFFVFLAFPLFFVGLLLLMVCIYKSPQLPNLLANIILVLNLFLGAYVVLLTLGPNPNTTDYGLFIQATGQKIIAYLLVLVLSFLAWKLREKVVSHSFE